jgi:hypothetical protein
VLIETCKSVLIAGRHTFAIEALLFPDFVSVHYASCQLGDHHDCYIARLTARAFAALG